MKKVFTREELIWVAQAKSILEAHGIACSLRNEYAPSVAGEVPFTHTWPELWVHHDSDVQPAMNLLKAWQEEMNESAEQPDYAAWQCEQCGETNEGQFALCWSCGLVLQPAG